MNYSIMDFIVFVGYKYGETAWLSPTSRSCTAPRLHPGRTVATLWIGCIQVCMESRALMHKLRIWKQVLFMKYSHHSVDWSLSSYLCSRWLAFVVLALNIHLFLSKYRAFRWVLLNFQLVQIDNGYFREQNPQFQYIHEVVAFSTVKPCILFIAYMRPSARSTHAVWICRATDVGDTGGKICICIHGFGRDTWSQWKLLTA